jgi:hypothetical protein
VFRPSPRSVLLRDERAKAAREWSETYPKQDTLADDSRETIYGSDQEGLF